MLRVYSGANENAPLLESIVESLRFATRLGICREFKRIYSFG